LSHSSIARHWRANGEAMQIAKTCKSKGLADRKALQIAEPRNHDVRE
jgi:hypothetical protein